MTRNKNYPSGYEGRCRQCNRERAKSRWHKDRDRAVERQRERRLRIPIEHQRAQERKYALKRVFGITVGQYEEMLQQQDGLCATCKQPEKHKRNGNLLRLCVDHDHKTGKVRGLLCNNCNRSLGLLSENIETLKSLIKYLEDKPK